MSLCECGSRELRRVAAALLMLSSVLVGCDATDSTDDQPSTIVMDDFESGAITDWQAVGSGSGGWFVYSDGQKAPDPDQSDPNVPFDVPDPPEGKFAAVTDMNGPGTRILYRDVKLDGRFMLHLTVFYAGSAPVQQPRHPGLRRARARTSSSGSTSSVPRRPSTPWRSGDVLVNVFRTVAGRSGPPPADRGERRSLAPGRARRSASASPQTDNQGPLRAGVDNIRFERIGADADARVELPGHAGGRRAPSISSCAG